MRSILRSYVLENARVFEFREFKYDREITNNPKKSGFEIHLERIAKKLKAAGCDIEKLAKGRFRFRASLPVTFREEP